MTRKTQIYVLSALLVVLATTVVANLSGSREILPGGSVDRFSPIDVKDPLLRLDLLEKIRKTRYPGADVNIFTGRPIPRPEPPKPVDPVPIPNPGPPPEPELVFPYRFYGVVVDTRTKRQRACFTNGEDIYIIAEGESIKNEWRLLRIGAMNADVEQISSSKRKTVPLEQLAGPGA